MHGGILGGDYKAAVETLGLKVGDDPSSYGYFAIFDLGKALVAMLFYVMARARLGAGPKTAVWAGVVAWLAVEVFPAIAMMPFPFFGKWFYVKAMALVFVPAIIGALIGGWIYREEAA